MGRYAALNQRDTAALLGMGTGSAVCRQLQRLRASQAADAALAGRVARIGLCLETAMPPRRKS